MKTYKTLNQAPVSAVFGLLALLALTSCKGNGCSVNDNSGKNDKTTSREGGVTLLITLLI